MKLRRSLIVGLLAGTLVVGSAPPANAMYLDIDFILFLASGGLIGSGDLSASYTRDKVSDGFARAQRDPNQDACEQDRPGKFQRKTSNGWDTVKSGRSNEKGKLKFKVAPKNGTYRILVPAYTPESTGFPCYKGVSETKKFNK